MFHLKIIKTKQTTKIKLHKGKRNKEKPHTTPKLTCISLNELLSGCNIEFWYHNFSQYQSCCLHHAFSGRAT